MTDHSAVARQIAEVFNETLDPEHSLGYHLARGFVPNVIAPIIADAIARAYEAGRREGMSKATMAADEVSVIFTDTVELRTYLTSLWALLRQEEAVEKQGGPPRRIALPPLRPFALPVSAQPEE